MERIKKIKTNEQLKKESKKFKTKKAQVNFVNKQLESKQVFKSQNKVLKQKRALNEKLYPNRGVYGLLFTDVQTNKFYEIDGKRVCYIGSSVDIDNRFKEHCKTINEKYNIPINFRPVIATTTKLPTTEENYKEPTSRKGWLLVEECLHWYNVYQLHQLHLINKCPWLLLSNVNFLGFKGAKK